MKIHSLDIKNIGPFKEAHLDFNADFNAETGQQPVTIITGNNGAGKSIIIDAIRAIFDPYCLERSIISDKFVFDIQMELEWDGQIRHLDSFNEKGRIGVTNDILFHYFSEQVKLPPYSDWVVDYWSSVLPSDSFSISTMQSIKYEEVFLNVFKGKKSHVELINFLCNIDYLRSSEMPEEKKLGEVLYSTIKTIVKECLDNGEFKYIRRSDLSPIVTHNGHDVSLDKLSSGNIFILEHLLLLLCKMYSVTVLHDLPIENVCRLSGFLLIDEIENHLHPKWQKKILGIIRRLFPNVQIILTTHSPFVVSSIKGAKVYTCVASNEGSKVVDTTEIYDNLPVDEVLVSDAFGVTPFNDEITELLRKRKELIKSDNDEEAEKIAKQLYQMNPLAFRYLKPAEV